MPSHRAALLALLAALLVTACGGAAPSSGAGTAPAATLATEPAASPDAEPTEPAASQGSGASDAPIPTEAPPTDAPTTTPEGTEAPIRTGIPVSADACSGSDGNRTFFEDAAHAVDWPVLCGVLPRGWFVDDGKYRLANGGWMRIGYRGPGGATLWLHQGAACATVGGCDPSGDELGAAALGPLDGTLFENDGGFAILVAPGENPSWYLTTTGLDQATTVQLAGRLAVVGG